MIKVPNKEKLIVALDVPDLNSAQKIVNDLGSEVIFYKMGLELMMSGQYFELIKWLKNQGKKVFCDLKLHDISQTVAKSVANLAKHDVDLLTIHISNAKTIEKVNLAKGKMQVVGVTILTNLDQNDLNQTGHDPNLSITEIVNKKTELALNNDLDGIVSSALEIKSLRQQFGNNFISVTPGIRLNNDVANDDQKRVADIKYAIENGSSYLVVGRPITQSNNPKETAMKFNQEIAKYS